VQVQDDGKILVGGDFSTFNGASKPYLARLNTNGALEASFPAGSGPAGSVQTSALQPDGKIIIGGLFSTVNGTNRNMRARLLGNGALDTNFVPVSVSVGEVRSCAVQSDGKLVFGGYFYFTGGVSNWTSVQRLLPDGTLDANNVGAPFGEEAYALAPDSDGSVLFGTGMLVAKISPMHCVGRMSDTGVIDTNLTTLDSIADSVGALAVWTNSAVVCGGDFSVIGSEPRYGLARFLRVLRPQLQLEPGGPPGVLQVKVGGRIGRNYAVETSTNFIDWIELTNFPITSGEMSIQIPMNRPASFIRAASR
jgi:uncharacterized delta-60 repeat protein